MVDPVTGRELVGVLEVGRHVLGYASIGLLWGLISGVVLVTLFAGLWRLYSGNWGTLWIGD